MRYFRSRRIILPGFGPQSHARDTETSLHAQSLRAQCLGQNGILSVQQMHKKRPNPTLRASADSLPGSALANQLRCVLALFFNRHTVAGSHGCPRAALSAGCGQEWRIEVRRAAIFSPSHRGEQGTNRKARAYLVQEARMQFTRL